MSAAREDFDALLDEAETHPVLGWDLSWLGDRLMTAPWPWDFTARVESAAASAAAMLDVATGGGEWLAGLTVRADRVIATESWPPNVAVASGRLRPLGITVVRNEPADDNAAQAQARSSATLPFRRAAFDLVTCRHGAVVASEVARVLASGGAFLTEQIGDGADESFAALLDLDPPVRRSWNLGLATTQIEHAGLRATNSVEGTASIRFGDVGALAWYLRMVPWVVPDFSVSAHRPALRQIHDRIHVEGPLSVALPGFVVDAAKP